MAWRPPTPRPEELDAKGGFYAWFNRGGFLISRDVVEGKHGLDDEATCPQACLGNSCRCGDNALPACVGTGVPTTSNDPNLSRGCFWWFVEVLASGQMKLIGKHDDPNWLQKTGAKLASWMTVIGTAYCSQTQTQTSGAATEKCVDKDNKPCTKGAAGCTCTTPSAATVGALGLFNFMAKGLCKNWLAEYTQKPTDPLPPIPDPPPLPSPGPSWLKLLAWILGGVAAGGVGAYVSARR
jgi:hypothetical protein